MKETGKNVKYKGLTIQIQGMWNLKTKVIMEETGTMLKSFRKHEESMKVRSYRKQPYWALHTHTAESTNVTVQNIQHGK
jgi:hypothetical protein